MTKTVVVAASMMFVSLLVCCAKGGVSVVMNGSFENDEQIIDPIAPDDVPDRWWDVNIPSNFGGRINQNWPTDGNYNLTVYSRAFQAFVNGQMATISQYIYPDDANEIIFDLKLETTHPAHLWDPNKRTAVVLIDDEVVWESNSVGSDVRGVYLDQVYDINQIYKDGQLHKLSLGIRADVNETWFITYEAKWDFVRFDTHCEGVGYLRADLNYDCNVDWLDVEVLAEHWLPSQWVDQTHRCDLFEDSEVDGYDLAVFADKWMDASNNYTRDKELLAMDINSDGIVNFIDYALVIIEWGPRGVNYEAIAELADEWLLEGGLLYDLQ